jgi:tetratricopeptide (TPR) repeat protein
MKKFILVIVLFFSLGIFAQNAPPDAHDSQPADTNKPALQDVPRAQRSGDAASPPADDESSSNSTKIDLSPPPGEPDFRTRSGDSDSRSGVHEVKPWDPHKSDKDVEVGDFYFKRHNYEAAESRYREALHWMDNNAVATFRLAQALEQQGRYHEAVKYYQQYLNILPRGPESNAAHKSIQQLANKPDQPAKASAQQLKLPEENQ